MPQLPSGREVALCFDPLDELIDTIFADAAASCVPILSMEQQKDLYPYVGILYLEAEGERHVHGLIKGSHPVDAALREVTTPWTITDVLANLTDWSLNDKNHFIQFLHSPRCQDLFQRQLAYLYLIKCKFRDEGSQAQQAEAKAWEKYVLGLLEV